MTRRAGGPVPLSAPGLIGPVSLPRMTGGLPGGRRRRRRSEGRHLRLVVDLVPSSERTSDLPVLRQIEAVLREAQVTELGDLVALSSEVLHACSAVGFRDVVHWEVQPGGWLPLHPLAPGSGTPSVGALLEAMQQREWSNVRGARTFAARLRGPRGLRLDLVLDRVHRARSHALTIDLVGVFDREMVHALVSALGRHLPIRSTSANVRTIDLPTR